LLLGYEDEFLAQLVTCQPGRNSHDVKDLQAILFGKSRELPSHTFERLFSKRLSAFGQDDGDIEPIVKGESYRRKKCLRLTRLNFAQQHPGLFRTGLYGQQTIYGLLDAGLIRIAVYRCPSCKAWVEFASQVQIRHASILCWTLELNGITKPAGTAAR